MVEHWVEVPGVGNSKLSLGTSNNAGITQMKIRLDIKFKKEKGDFKGVDNYEFIGITKVSINNDKLYYEILVGEETCPRKRTLLLKDIEFFKIFSPRIKRHKIKPRIEGMELAPHSGFMGFREHAIIPWLKDERGEDLKIEVIDKEKWTFPDVAPFHLRIFKYHNKKLEGFVTFMKCEHNIFIQDDNFPGSKSKYEKHY